MDLPELEDGDGDGFSDGSDLFRGIEPVPVVQVAQLPRTDIASHWLVEGLWFERGVGIVGGEPKAFKSYLSLEIAVAVASGVPAMRRFAVPRPGPVVLHQGEDAPHVVRARCSAIAHAAGVDLATVPLYVSTAPTLRLDVESDRLALLARLAALRPRLVVLDPLVRLHRVDENVVQEIAPILSYLRQLERQLETAILVVHHAKKSTSARMRGGQALRGSSELHAWGDSTLYSRRVDEHHTLLTVEHRAAAGSTHVLALRNRPGLDEDEVVLDVVDDEPVEVQAPTAAPSLRDRVLDALRGAVEPVRLRLLREQVRCRAAALSTVLNELMAEGRVVHDRRGYAIQERAGDDDGGSLLEPSPGPTDVTTAPRTGRKRALRGSRQAVKQAKGKRERTLRPARVSGPSAEKQRSGAARRARGQRRGRR